MPVYELDGIIPVVDPDAYIHPTAILIGDAIVGPGCYVGPGAVMRGDFGRLELKEGVNLQDTCVMHGFPGTDTVVEENGHIGHGAVLHGCQIGRNALVGMNAVVMDGARIGENAFVAASAFVKAGFEVPAGSLAAGTPARVIRDLTEEEIAWKGEGTREYQELALRSAATMRETEALHMVEPDRKRMPVTQTVPLFQKKQKPE